MGLEEVCAMGIFKASSICSNQLLERVDFPKEDVVEKIPLLPPGIEPLVLWQQEDLDGNWENSPSIVVDPLLVRFLRPHQREGVRYMFECVAGLSKEPDVNGCILADDIGLGKTWQPITLLYTLIRQGFDGKPIAKRAMIITPTCPVSNWESEIKKWLDARVQVIASCETTRADVLVRIDNYLAPYRHNEILIVSYETFRMHSSRFEKPGSCDLLICDEPHRLKNNQTLTNEGGEQAKVDYSPVPVVRMEVVNDRIIVAPTQVSFVFLYQSSVESWFQLSQWKESRPFQRPS